MNIITNKCLTANQFVECYTGWYFIHCDTLNETINCCNIEGVSISKGYELINIDKIPNNAHIVLVKFSTEEDYTDYEYRFMRIQKKYINRFLKNLKNL